LLTAGGIAIGIAVIVALLALADGLTAQITEIMTGSGAEITLMQAGVADMSFSVLDEGVGETVAAMPQVEWVTGMLLSVVPLEQKPLFLVLGLDPQGMGIRHFQVVEGRPLQDGQEVLLGRMAADFLRKDVGDVLVLQNRSYRVVGIYETGVGYEDAGGVLPLAEAQRLFRKEGQVSFYQVKVRPEAVGGLNALVEAIEAHLPEVVAYRSSDFARHLPDIRNFQTLAGAISLIGLLAGALGTMNTMLMSVLERTREIGTLRALGWRQREVLRLILQESLLLGLCGGVIGLVMGAGLVALIGLNPALQGMLAGQLTGRTLFIGLGVALGLSVLGGLYPAWRAARLQPIEALRYE
jgi:putative ABC transport system permease protein